MSVKRSSAVWDDPVPGNSNERLALLALADHADDDGYCWPSMPRIAEKVGCSPRNAMRLIQRLEARGKVYIERGKGRGNSNRYIVLPGLTAAEVRQTLVFRFGKTPEEAAAIVEVLKRDKADTIKKGDNPGVKRDRIGAKRDKAMSPYPSVDPSKETSNGGTEAEPPVIQSLRAFDDALPPGDRLSPQQYAAISANVLTRNVPPERLKEVWDSCQHYRKPIAGWIEAMKGRCEPYQDYRPTGQTVTASGVRHSSGTGVMVDFQELKRQRRAAAEAAGRKGAA